MSEENAALEAEQEVATDPPAEADFSSQEQAEPAKPERDYEAEARKMGWKPKEEWDGEPSHHKDAKTYVEHGENIVRIAKAETRTLEDKIKEQEKLFEKRISLMERMGAETRKREAERHKTELENVRKQQRQAVVDGDTDAFDRLSHQMDVLNANAPSDKQSEGDPNAEYQSKVEKFQSENVWYGTDDVLTAYANDISQKRARDNPNITFEENARLTIEAVKQRFPEKFGAKKAANGHAAVDGGGSFPTVTQKKTLASKLPPEAAAQAKEDVKAGLYKSADAWAEVYFAR
jgi:hypothetical protein